MVSVKSRENDVVALVDDFAAVGPQAPMGRTVGVPRCMAEREKPGGTACFLQPLAQLQEPSGVLGELLEAGGTHGADTVVEGADRAALRQRDPRS